jgi:hypothetical protein
MDGQASTARQSLGFVLAHRGAFAEAEALEQRAAAEFAAIGDRRLESGSHQYLAIARLLAGDAAGAEAPARASLAIDQRPSQSRAMGLGVLSETLLAQGDVAGALAAAREAMLLLEAFGGALAEGEARVRLAWSLALDAAGDHAGALQAIATARVRLDECAARITDPALRASYLTRVPENARIVATAGTWAADQTLPD